MCLELLASLKCNFIVKSIIVSSVQSERNRDEIIGVELEHIVFTV